MPLARLNIRWAPEAREEAWARAAVRFTVVLCVVTLAVALIWALQI